MVGVDLRSARLEEARLVEAEMPYALLTGANFSSARLEKADLTGGVQAQDGPTGIAFSYAAEQGSGVCTGADAAAAIACAQEKCVETSGAFPDECVPVSWCFPAGWSVTVGIMHKEGIHWSEFSCGWPSREAALAAGKVLCDAGYREYLQDCAVGLLYDENGTEIVLEDGQ